VESISSEGSLWVPLLRGKQLRHVNVRAKRTDIQSCIWCLILLDLTHWTTSWLCMVFSNRNSLSLKKGNKHSVKLLLSKATSESKSSSKNITKTGIGGEHFLCSYRVDWCASARWTDWISRCGTSRPPVLHTLVQQDTLQRSRVLWELRRPHWRWERCKENVTGWQERRESSILYLHQCTTNYCSVWKVFGFFFHRLCLKIFILEVFPLVIRVDNKSTTIVQQIWSYKKR